MKAQMEKLVTKGMLMLPSAMRDTLLKVQPVEIAGNRLDEDVAALLVLLEKSGRPALDEIGRQSGVEAARRAFREAVRPASEVEPPRTVVTSDLTLAGAAGPLRARLYTPDRAPLPGPLLVYFHGGGYVVGDLESHDPYLRYVAAKSVTRVLSVEYRLAPEHPYPAAAEDAVAAYADAAARAEMLGADPARLAIGGDSAGGTLALVAALAGVTGPRPPAALWLINPAADKAEAYPSATLYASGFLLTQSLMDWFMDQYFPDKARMAEPMASPMRSDDLGRLPRTFVTAGRFDPLSDQVPALAEKLKAAGVPVEARMEPGLVHNFPQLIAFIPAARRATDSACEWLRFALG
ncbi:alpha/beta hydrolase [Rhodospirillum centenum]|uniref:Lipase n=1 Tax=Rhodospirillum centenum (strain ATCC 51521 / SW) TaxID=414684 RepID=B6IUH8_RHOCS|nr:alpha/beta hydrolase [Rhodospirillum centenum]ACI99803.1 lipase [Rhodospirillum centenum SW]